MPGTHNGPAQCAHGRSMKLSCSKCPRPKDRRTDEEIMESVVPLVCDTISDIVQAMRALNVDPFVIRSGLMAVKDHIDVGCAELLTEGAGHGNG